MKGLESLRRSVSREEVEVISWLLDHGQPGAVQFGNTLERLTVVAKCNCGCPTIYFEIDGDPATSTGERIISDHLGTVDGQDVGVMLFAINDQLSSLEVYSQAGSDKPFGLPKVSDLYSFEESTEQLP